MALLSAGDPAAGVVAADGAIDWDAVHAAFPINANWLWLNNCGIAPPPPAAVSAVTTHLAALASRGIFGVPTESAMHDAVRGPLARLIGADVDELSLCHNTNEAMTFLSHGLDLTPGDHILLLENEYPSNVYPFEHWRARGVALSFVPLGASPAEFLGHFAQALRPRTRAVSLSAVHWCTGMPLPLAEVGKICAERGIDFFVDGSQGVGHVAIDVRAQGITGLACSAWKWLLGPVGTGALYVRRERLPSLRFPWKGTASVVDDEVYLPYRDAIKPTTDRYVLSTPNSNDWVYFAASLGFLEGLGFARVRARIQALGAHLAAGLRARGFVLASDAFAEDTGIIAARKPGHDSAALVAKLRAQGIVAAERLGWVRLAPHVYQLPQQLDRVAAALA
ncbi:MAG TPA: aminotransferase class V-fold PLP-dependent enzyme [Polyangia bacterium]